MNEKNKDKIMFEGRLHWIIFVWPVILMIISEFVYLLGPFYVVKQPIFVIGLAWGLYSLVNYLSSSIRVTENFLIIRKGVLTRQTLNFSIQQLESVDVQQRILGCILNYGVLSVRGTGGTCGFFGPLASPLTCRRFLESVP